MTLLASVALTSCDQDFNEGLAGPLTSPAETPQTVAFGNGAVAEVPAINLADVTADLVKVCNITAPTVTDANATLTGYVLKIGDVEYALNENGEMNRQELTDLVEGLYGKRPVERTVSGIVKAYFNANGQSLVTTSDAITLKVIPQAPNIEPAYYLTGTINGWNNSDTTYKLTNNGGDPYENPTYTR